MKLCKKTLGLLLGMVATTTSAIAADTVIRTDRIKIGKQQNTDKFLEFDTNAGAANPKIKYNTTTAEFAFANDGTNFLGFGSGSGGGTGFNAITLNPEFEQAVSAGWTNTGGTFVQVTSGSNLLFGRGSATFDASATSQFFESNAYTVPEGLKARPCLVRAFYLGGDANLKLQALDGSANVLGEVTLGTVTQATPIAAPFTCPSSGTIKLRVTSTADAAIASFDRMHLGENDQLFQFSQASYIGKANYANTAACVWSRTNTALGAFTADADCPVLTVADNPGPGTIQAVDADLPQLTINNLPPGVYHISVNVTVQAGAATTGTIAMSDGTTTTGQVTTALTNGDDYPLDIHGSFTYTTTANRTFSIVGATANSSLSISMTNVATSPNPSGLRFRIYRYPSTAEQALKLDQAAWRVDANISGANPSLGTGTVAAYAEVTNGSLTLVQNSGSQGVQIACASGTASTGTTCSVNESVGIAFQAPRAGSVMACVSFSHDASVAATSDVTSTFQIVETTNTSSAVVAEGNTRLQSEIEASGTGAVDISHPLRLCGTFNFVSAGLKTLRLAYEQTTSGTVNSNVLDADAAGANGQRDIHWEVFPMDVPLPMPILVNSVMSTSNGIERMERVSSANVNCTSSPCGLDSSTPGVTSVTRTGTGLYSLNFSVGTYSAAPTCSGITRGASQLLTSSSVPTATAFTFEVRNSTTGAAADGAFHLVCQGAK